MAQTVLCSAIVMVNFKLKTGGTIKAIPYFVTWYMLSTYMCRCTHHSSQPILARGLASEIPIVS